MMMGLDDDSARTEPERTGKTGETMSEDPQGGAIDGTAIMMAAAKASVPASVVPYLLDAAQEHLAEHALEYVREFECVYADEELAIFFVPLGHWDTQGLDMDFSPREVDAVRRAHAEHLRRLGTDTDRRDEFETALEIREVAVIGRR
ncbi:hypothetical protein ACFQJC_03775 [Haloferax namakaokahaiae]|uniref:DUF8048 domain-containing protein n=1 Tax=Haloferax namakaokahaiae TaxID=1748331 RepID=A0ABD5ZBR4_9EURY